MNWIDEVYEKDFAELLDREILLARAKTFRKIFK